MHDTFLLNKVSKSLGEICEKYNIRRIEKFTIVVNHNSHLNEHNLREHLGIYSKNIIADNLEIEVRREDIEEQTAIIHNIEGETSEV
jgi:Zn finger protein HypA/HybF involved in hydrogenase expression